MLGQLGSCNAERKMKNWVDMFDGSNVGGSQSAMISNLMRLDKRNKFSDMLQLKGNGKR